ncbi:polysaccharide deacetylase family protein [bacterium]|nr:polysaccharide deacetylase family protein [bacterium]
MTKKRTAHPRGVHRHNKKSTQMSKGAIDKRQLLLVVLMSFFLSACGILLTRDVYQLDQNQHISQDTQQDPGVSDRYRKLRNDLSELIRREKAAEIRIVDQSAIEQLLDKIKINIATNNTAAAQADIDQAQQKLAAYRKQVDSVIASRTKKEVTAQNATQQQGVYAPILMYHLTPADFEQQLITLKSRGYTAITMSELTDGLRDPTKLPAKPVAITFDDGYSDQFTAFSLLKKYNMKATFYVITSGNASNYCIGMNRKRNQATPCGDNFMNTAEIKQLDQSGIIEIGGHTVDHLNLASLSAQNQAFQIKESKRALEALLGHPIRSFAYPYGSFNQSAVDQVVAAGYDNAVTTVAGTNHTTGQLFTLTRVRDPYTLK